jgi:hypothetical protein
MRNIREGLGLRIYQVQKPKNRHLVDLRPVEDLPPSQHIAGILVVTPPELIAGKVRAYHHRRGQPRAFSDLRDIAALFLAFPALKIANGEVSASLQKAGADASLLATLRELAAQQITPNDDSDID